MQNKPTAFESLKAGKGRLYPMPKEKRIEEWNRLNVDYWIPKPNPNANNAPSQGAKPPADDFLDDDLPF